VRSDGSRCDGKDDPNHVVTFTKALPWTNPAYYSVAVTSMGSVSYWSLPASDQRTGQPYMVEFAASRAARAKIFRLAQELHFFQGKFGTSEVARHESNPKS